MPDYLLYGLVVRSDRALDGLDLAPPGLACDVTVALGGDRPTAKAWDDASTYYRSTADAERGPVLEVRRTSNGGYWFWYEDGTAFALDATAARISAWWSESSTLADTATYLLGPVLGFALRLRGVLALHASAVLLGGRALALVGPSGAGKSTTAGAFARAGIPVLADDVVAIRLVEGELVAYPSYRLLRLWDESERILFGTSGQLPRLTPTWDKRALPLDDAAHPFHAAPAPLGDVLIFGDRQDEERAPVIEAMTAREAFVSLLENTYANYLLDDRMRADEMRMLESVVRTRRVRRLVPHAQPDRLAQLVTIVRHSVALTEDA